MSQRVFITGATGFLGGAVARHLHATGWAVTASGRNAEAGQRLRDQGIRFVALDLASNAQAVSDAISSHDSVVHCAALSAPWGKRLAFEQANVTATAHVISACQTHRIQRLVHISSPSVSFAFQPMVDEVESTSWTAASANHYIATKRAAERLVCDAINAQLPAIILRPKALIGHGDTTLLPRVIKIASRGKFPAFGPDCLLDLTAISDACAAIELALKAPQPGGIYHITSGQPISRKLALETVFEACGLTVKWKQLPQPFALALGSTLEWTSRLFTAGRWEPPLTRYSVGALGFGQTLNISAARRDLDYTPQADILETLRSCGEAWRSAQ
jgi:nucleoside-diphosphate-sugar epimerase